MSGSVRCYPSIALRFLLAALLGLFLSCSAPTGLTVELPVLSGPDKLLLLPTGSIEPGGWMAQQMREDTQGWIRTVQDMSSQGIWIAHPRGKRGDPLLVSTGRKGPFYLPFLERNSAPVAGEYQLNWLDGVLRLGWAAGLPEYRELGGKAIKDLIESADADGYIGVESEENRFNKVLNPDNGDPMAAHFWRLWSWGLILDRLVLHYRYTGDQRSLEACRKASDLLCNNLAPQVPEGLDPGTQKWSITPTIALAKLYMLTGDKRYLEKAEFILRRFVTSYKGIVSLTYDKMIWESDLLEGHAAGWGIVMHAMLDLYKAGGDPQWYEGIQHVHRKLLDQHVQPHGSTSGQWELFAGKGPALCTELCDTFWWSFWWARMTAHTGETIYADYAEKAFLNALPATRSKGGSTMAYFHSPNQVEASRATGGTQYPSRLYVECCQSNGPRLLPAIAEYLVLATQDSGLAVPFYVESETQVSLANGKTLVLTQRTGYPFEGKVILEIDCNGSRVSFPLLLRIPAWCDDASIEVNGEKLETACQPGSWARIERDWNSGDQVVLSLPMEIKVANWNDRAVIVERGPLLYALPIEGERKELDQWGAFEEVLSPGTRWQYALKLDPVDPASSFTLIHQEVPADSKVWEQSPLALEVDARYLEGWNFELGKSSMHFANCSPGLPGDDVVSAVEDFEKVRLVPYGFTTLRLTYLPVVYLAK